MGLEYYLLVLAGGALLIFLQNMWVNYEKTNTHIHTVNLNSNARQGKKPPRRISWVIRFSSALIALIRETWAMDRRPCFVLAAMTRAFPSGVLGPVLLPPCSWHRVLFLRAGLRQTDPRRVLAPHLAPGQWSPNRVLNPTITRLWGLVIVTICFTPFVGSCDKYNNIASYDPRF